MSELYYYIDAGCLLV